MSALALPHLERVRRYYRDFGGEPRVRQLERTIAELLRRVRAFPGAYPMWRAPIRRIVDRRFYLAIFYQVRTDHILILLVADQRQDPRRLRFTAR
jgi:plasmid stabilization system protein ParE